MAAAVKELRVVERAVHYKAEEAGNLMVVVAAVDYKVGGGRNCYVEVVVKFKVEEVVAETEVVVNYNYRTEVVMNYRVEVAAETKVVVNYRVEVAEVVVNYKVKVVTEMMH